MEAVAYLGGAFTLAGVMAFLAQWRHRRRLIMPAAILTVLGVSMVGVAYYELTRPAPVVAQQANPRTATSSQASPASVPVPTTVAGFAALSADQQRAVMQQEIDRYNSVLDEAYRNLDLTLLPAVTTGPELQVQQQQLATLKAKGRPTAGSDNYTITGIGTSPALGSVTVKTQGTESSWYLDPTTHQQVGQATVNSQPASYTLVPEGGVWKVEAVALG